MTVEEAISRFTDEINGEGFYNDNAHREMAIEALEKQIPKKAKRGGIYGPSCPSCYKSITEEYLGPYLMHCPFCGQALDWSKDDDN